MSRTTRSVAYAVSLLLTLAGLGLVASPASAALTYYYAEAHQTFTGTLPNGISGNITADNVSLTAGDFHTLTEIAIHVPSTGQAIEVGMNIDPTVYGNSSPHLFVNCWLNGTSGGYNQCVHPLISATNYWVDYAANPLNAGATLTVDQAYSMRIQYDAADCGAAPNGWWVQVAGSAVGCFRDDRWTGQGVTFVNGPFLQAFGEVAANVASPCTDMGRNPAVLATTTSHLSGGAQIGSISIPNLGSGAVNMNSYTVTNASWYNAVLASGSMRSVNFGGPGAC